MPIKDSGPLGLIADIEAEFPQPGTTDISLFQARTDAGLPAGEVAMTDFYGLSDAIAPSVTTNSATSVTTSSMVARGNVTSDGGGTIIERGFYFGTNSASPTNNTKYTVSGTTGSFSRSFTGLPSNSTRYYWAYAKNSAGTTYGARITQLTAYNYTFSSTTMHQVASPNSAAKGRKYFQNISGGYTLHATIPADYALRCITHCTNRRNRWYFTGGWGSVYDSGIFRITIAQNGCGTISGITNRGSSGSGRVNVYSNTVVIERFTSYNFYYDVP